MIVSKLGNYGVKRDDLTATITKLVSLIVRCSAKDDCAVQLDCSVAPEILSLPLLPHLLRVRITLNHMTFDDVLTDHRSIY